jgi:hypothetical protein
LKNLDAPQHSAHEGLRLILGKIVSDVLEQNRANRRTGFLDFPLIGLPIFLRWCVEDRPGTLNIVYQPWRHRFDRQHKIDEAGRDGAGWHALMTGAAVIRPLGDRQAPAFLDRLDTERAITSAARQHDADRVFTAFIGQGFEKDIDGMMFARLIVLGARPQPSALDR